MDAELRLQARPDLVRTARLVVGAAARRAGVHADLLDEVRLAVGEAAAGAVVRLDKARSGAPVLVRWRQTRDSFDVEVSVDTSAAEHEADAAPPNAAPDDAAAGGDVPDAPAGAPDDADLSLAVVAALVATTVSSTPTSRTLAMTWPLG